MNTAGYSEKKISFINTKHRGTTSKVGRVGGLLSLFLKLKKSISILENMFWLLWVKFLILNAVSRVAIICCRWDLYGSALIPRNLLYPKKVFFLEKIFHKKLHQKVLSDVHIITKAIEIYRKCLDHRIFCWIAEKTRLDHFCYYFIIFRYAQREVILICIMCHRAILPKHLIFCLRKNQIFKPN